MATLTIRRVDDHVLAALKVRARRNRRSLEAEVRQLLSDAVSRGSATSLRDLADQIALDFVDNRRQRLAAAQRHP